MLNIYQKTFMDAEIEKSWKRLLYKEFPKQYFRKLSTFVKNEYSHNKVFPAGKDIFRAFDLCTFENTRVVIIGQDPYHGVGQANGLCFSVANGGNIPPSLRNIYKELENDLGKQVHTSGDLVRWARQGVLLLNSTLTVRKSEPGSHQKMGWEQFTDAVIKIISEQKSNVVFLLWGKYAQEKGSIIDSTKHLVLKASHPSPFSASRGFLGSRPFSKTNKYLIDHGYDEINW